METEVELAYFADHEVFGELQILRLEPFPMGSQAVEADSLAAAELWADSSLRNTNSTSHLALLLHVPPGK